MRLTERFARGDLDAFELLFRQYQADVYRWVRRLARDPAAAEDLTLETFWRIYHARASFDPSRSFGAWARRIASNVAVDHLRRVRRSIAPIAVPERASHTSSARLDLHVRVERAFLRLPAKLRVVAELAFIHGWTHDEIAEALGISRTAVKFRAIRARRFLRTAFGEEGISS